jgi:hypothetical protein
MNFEGWEAIEDLKQGNGLLPRYCKGIKQKGMPRFSFGP